MAGGLERGTRELREVARDLVGPAAKELGQLFADRIRIYRITSTLKAAQEAKRQIAASGMTQKPVSLKVLVPALEGASLEEDDDLTSRWAGLIATAATTGEVLPSFAEILRQLSPEEARLLDRIHADTQGDPRAVVDGSKLFAGSGMGVDRFNVLMESLARSALIGRTPPDTAFVPLPTDPWNLERWVNITRLGNAFVRACQGPSQIAE